MSKYCAPITDMIFHIKGNSAIDNDDAGLILDQAAEFSEQVWGSVNQHGDQNGCRYKDGKVLLDPKIRDAFKAFSEAGWMGISMPEEWGGQALPEALSSKVSEMLTSTNQSLCMFTALTSSACKALISFGNDELKQTYLHNMVSGNWTGTMCLTESHCGSDLGEIKSSAKINADNSYAISGTKIFISTGDHDASDNIIHLVLARIKGAPEGIKGLSLFLVPKIFPDNNEYNSLSCIGIEEKMGIHSNPTCTMAFEEAKGFLVGEENGGIKAMFKMMNEMRLGTSLQGVGMSEQSFQASYQYAVERVQGQSLDKKLRGQTTGLIGHADVRRMLLTQKAFAEGGRAFCHYCAELLDREKAGNDAEAAKLLGLLTPIAKAFLTETGQESASLAVQVYGGHGYITETGVEQIYRDGRISTLYEGTTGIQSLDLLGRKVLGDQGQALMLFTKQLHVLSKSILKQDSDT
ncbi:acyl-CoA dehydrogenase, partial [Oleiphilus sp. HI0069]